MPPSPPVLLVLAWDDADPAVHHVAATAALPALPTLPLVRALAAEQPTLAVLPQLPETAAADTAAAAVVDLGAGSHLVGLGDFTPGALATGWAPTAAPPPAPGAPATKPLASLANVQLRPSLAQRAEADWQAPAAPYLGSAAPATETAITPTVETPAAEATSVAEAAAATAGAPAMLGAPAAPVAPPSAGAPSEPAFATPTAAMAPTPLFDQPEAEIGAGEAADLAEDDPDLSVDADLVDADSVAAPAAGAARASLTQGLAALHRPPNGAPAAVPAFDLSDGLHYRVIQYARFASYVLDAGEDFGVIYAPDWPTWLAALEIRARTRRPLVVHLRLLGAESAAPAERGWLLELERMVLRFAHTVLVTSDELGAQALRHYPLVPSNVRTVAADDADGVRAVLAEIGRAARP